ncbi:MAG: hypothetical protein DMF88_26850 [Acidobacteria bacterium]|nr:MAG: hypothetical protein DMF88_26850 [Acidobacteriota bacterium]
MTNSSAVEPRGMARRLSLSNTSSSTTPVKMRPSWVEELMTSLVRTGMLTPAEIVEAALVLLYT